LSLPCCDHGVFQIYRMIDSILQWSRIFFTVQTVSTKVFTNTFSQQATAVISTPNALVSECVQSPFPHGLAFKSVTGIHLFGCRSVRKSTSVEHQKVNEKLLGQKRGLGKEEEREGTRGSMWGTRRKRRRLDTCAKTHSCNDTDALPNGGPPITAHDSLDLKQEIQTNLPNVGTNKN
jgi:hypothetical protein